MSGDQNEQACPEKHLSAIYIQQVIIEDINAKQKGIKVFDTAENSDNLN